MARSKVRPQQKRLTDTLAHALEWQGAFSKIAANGYALLDYAPCWHPAEFRSDRLTRFLPLTRGNLRLAFGQDRGDRWWQRCASKRRSTL